MNESEIIEIKAVCTCGHADVDHHNKLVGSSMQWAVCELCDCPEFQDEDNRVCEICEGIDCICGF